MKKARRLSLGVILAAALVHNAAHAKCDQSDATASDKALRDLYTVTQEFADWHHWTYHTHGVDWADRGFFAADDLRLEYSKHMNAAWLTIYGLKNFGGGFGSVPPFHDGELDYYEVGRGHESVWHEELKHMPLDDPNRFGRWRSESGEDPLFTSCPLYDATIATATPSRRASDFVHEGWHAWKYAHGIENPEASGGHYGKGPIPICSGGKCVTLCTSGNCDYFYPHAKADFPAATLYQSDVDNVNHYHSVYQVQMEFFCDVSDSGAFELPPIVKITAEAEGNSIRDRFINGSPITCGSPFPLPIGVLEVGTVANGGFCGAGSDCKSNCCSANVCARSGACIK